VKLVNSIVGFDPFIIEANISIQDDQIFIDESNYFNLLHKVTLKCSTLLMGI